MGPSRKIVAMRAAYLQSHGGPEVLQVGELPDPVAGPTEALVEVRFSGLNHLDLWVRRGLPNLKLAYPHVLGCDAAGVVRSVGPAVTHLQPGDEVVVHPGLSCGRCERCLSGWETLCPEYRILGEHVSGTNAELIRVPAGNCYPKPKSLSFAEAAVAPLVFTTAWQMVVGRGEVKPGDKVLVHAVGSGVGSAALQIALLHGAEVIATAGDDAKLERAKAMGAHHTINYRKTDLTDGVKRLARSGVDVVIDHLGKDFWGANLRATRWGGRVVVCGATTGFEAVTDLRHVFFRQLSLLGSTMGSKGDFPRILQLLGDRRLQAVVGKIYPLDSVREAHGALEAREVFGKIAIQI